MQILKLANGKTFADLRRALARQGPPPAWMKEVGGPNAPAPGTESNATLMMQPGNYAIICFVDIGGAPHFTKGMVRPLKVVASSGPAASNPTPDVTATLFDYNFRLSTPIVAGTHTIKVVNNGTQPHEIELVQLAPGKTANDFLTWAGGGMKGPPPAKPIGGVAGLERGMSQSFTANFTPGNYAFICFIPDAKDGKPHFMHGMTKDFSVR
jgi:plastocyanin